MSSMSPRKPRASRACVACHQRKVRCDLTSTGTTCSPCIRDRQVCEPRLRKREARNKLLREVLDIDSPLGRVTEGEVTRSPVVGFDGGISSGDVSMPELHTKSPRGADDLPLEPLSSMVAPGDDSVDTPQQGGWQTLRGKSSQTAITDNGPSRETAYVGREAYMIPEPAQGQGEVDVYSIDEEVTVAEKQILELQKCFDLPSRSIQEILFTNYFTYCHPWAPIVDRTQVEKAEKGKMSILLLQAIFLAGSRVSSIPLSYADPAEFYRKAKTLFWLGVEKDPMINLKAACLLNWWNPHGPERVSIDTSSFWIRVATSLAHQIGLHREYRSTPTDPLRRRVWWSIVCRDCLISAGHGRPQAIKLDDSQVSGPKVEDFPDNKDDAQLFISYVKLCVLMGDYTKHALRNPKSRCHSSETTDRLFRWIKTLPSQLRLYGPATNHIINTYDLRARLLHVPFFALLAIINRPQTLDEPPRTIALLASSFITGIFEDFIVRDELRYHPPISSFYLLTAALVQLHCYRYASLWPIAEEQIQTLSLAQKELAKRWPSALGSLKTFERIQNLAKTQPQINGFPEYNLTLEEAAFFDDFGPELCKLWDILRNNSAQSENNMERESSQGPYLTNVATDPLLAASDGQEALRRDGLPSTSANTGLLDFNFDGQSDQYFSFGGMGDWLSWEDAIAMDP